MGSLVTQVRWRAINDGFQKLGIEKGRDSLKNSTAERFNNLDLCLPAIIRCVRRVMVHESGLWLVMIMKKMQVRGSRPGVRGERKARHIAWPMASLFSTQTSSLKSFCVFSFQHSGRDDEDPKHPVHVYSCKSNK